MGKRWGTVTQVKKRNGINSLAIAVILIAPPAVIRAQGNARTEVFEIASVKPEGSARSQTDLIYRSLQESMQNSNPGFLPVSGKTVRLENWSLRTLIASAYKVSPRYIVGPDYLSDLRYTVDAKLPSNAPNEKANELLRALLIDRFALRCHTETKGQAGYALLVAKNGPNLNPSRPTPGAPPPTGADLTERSDQKLKELQAEMQRTGTLRASTGSRLRGVRVSALAQSLSAFLGAPVQDSTGLTGRYDIDFVILPADGPEDTPEYRASVMLAKLGLRLESRKIPVESIVIDAVSAVPTEN